MLNFASLSAAEEYKMYTVKSVHYFDDDGYNDEIGVTLGNGEIQLLIRWYTGIRFMVGDQVIVYFHPENKTIVIDGNIYDCFGDSNFYHLW